MMKLYDANGKMIEGNWKLCKEITVNYDDVQSNFISKIIYLDN